MNVWFSGKVVKAFERSSEPGSVLSLVFHHPFQVHKLETVGSSSVELGLAAAH